MESIDECQYSRNDLPVSRRWRIDPRAIEWRLLAGLAPIVSFVAAMWLYLRTGAPSLLTGDQAEHQMVAVTLGVPHATGYPLFTLLNAAAVRLLPLGDMARRVTVMSSLWGALAVLFAFLVVRRLSGSTFAALVGALVLAVAPEFWSLATIAEVYTFQALLILVVWWQLLRWWDDESRATPLYIAALLAGLATSHHGSFAPIALFSLLTTVAWPLFRWRAMNRESGAWRRRIAGVLGCGALGLTPWLYLAIQFALFHPFDYYRGQGLPYHYYWGNPASWGDVVNLAFGAGFRAKVFTHAWADLGRLTLHFGSLLRMQVGANGLLLGMVGASSLLFGRQRRAGLFSALLFGSAALFGMNVAGDVPKAGVYYLPAYVIWSVWEGVGAARLLAIPVQVFERRFARENAFLARSGAIILVGVAALALIGLPLWAGYARFSVMDRSDDYAPREFAEAVLAQVEPNATILCRWEQCRSLQYLQLVEGRRLDVILDQTEPEAGVDWADRAALYYPTRPVYAVSFNPQLAQRYPVFPISETYDLWQVMRP